MSLYIVRHGESIGNDRAVVQGGDFNPGLTETGRRQARTVATQLKDTVGDRVSVYTSPARRATETAAIIARMLDVPVEVDDRLVEVDPGVIAGMSKAHLRDRWPEFLNVWEARGDLDAIPGAETGAEAQGRALSVLDTITPGACDHVIVAHAAFNRYLVNTARGRIRTEPIGHDPLNWSVVEDEPLSAVSIAQLPNGKRSETRLIETFDGRYVIKQEPGVTGEELAFQQWFADYINTKYRVFPDILAWYADDVGRQVMSYVAGTHKRGPLSSARRDTLCEAVSALSVFSRQATREFPVDTLADRIDRIVQTTSTKAIRDLGEQFLETELLGSDDTDWPYVHFDLHRDNLLFNGDDVTIVDLGGISRAPPTYQPASLFTAGFMLEDPTGFDLDNVVARWPETLDRDRLAMAMLVRAYVGLEFFVRRETTYGLNAQEVQILDRYVQTIRRIATEYLGWTLPNRLTGGALDDG